MVHEIQPGHPSYLCKSNIRPPSHTGQVATRQRKSRHQWMDALYLRHKHSLQPSRRPFRLTVNYPPLRPLLCSRPLRI